MQAQRVLDVVLRKEQFAKKKVEQLRLHKPIYDPRPASQQIRNSDKIYRLLKDLETAPKEVIKSDARGLVAQYSSSCWLKLLAPSPSQSEKSVYDEQ